MWLNLRAEVEELFAHLEVFIDSENENFQTWKPSLQRYSLNGYDIINPATLERLRAVDTPERMRARSRAWKARNRERVAAYSKARYLARRTGQ